MQRHGLLSVPAWGADALAHAQAFVRKHRHPLPPTSSLSSLGSPPQLDDALELGAAEFISKYLLYFIHERLWIIIPLV